MLECKICGKQCKNKFSLAMHVVRAHNMSTEQYVNEYTDLNKNCKLCGQPSRFLGINRGYAPLCEHCGRVKSLDAFKILYGDEEGTRIYTEYQPKKSGSLQNLKRKYGEEQGQKIYEQRCKEASFRNSKKGYIARMGEEKGKQLFEENKRKRNRGLQFCIKEYGKKEGTKIHKEWASKCKNNLEAMIRKYGYEEGVKRYDKKIEKQKQSYNKEWLIQTYGEEEGNKRYSRLWYGKSKGISWAKGSKESIKLFAEVEDLILNKYTQLTPLDIYVGDNTRYEWITYGTDYFYCIDFCIPRYKIAIEYNGIAFHPHPKWKQTDTNKWNNWKCLFSKANADIVYASDNKKIKFLKSLGFKVLTIWSDDEVDYNIKKCWRFIDAQIKRYL